MTPTQIAQETDKILSIIGASLHTQEPLAVVDRVGFLHTGQDAWDIMYAACAEHIEKNYADPEKTMRLDALAQSKKESDELRKMVASDAS